MALRTLGGVQAIRDLRAELELGERERDLEERDVDARDPDERDLAHRMADVCSMEEVAGAIEWLMACRRPDGCWGEQQEGTTALAMLAVAKWRSTGQRSTAAREAAVAFDLEPSARWLAAQARADGSWSTPWYTGVALQALVVADYDGPVLERSRRYLGDLDPADRQYWHDRVHHAAQILTALSLLRAPGDERDPWVACIVRHLDAGHGAYVCGQAVHA